MNGDVDDEADEVCRLLVARLVEFKTEEKVEVKGDAVVVLTEGLFDGPDLRPPGSSDDVPTLVVKGVRPRRTPGVGADSPQADCCVLAGLALIDLFVLEANEF